MAPPRRIDRIARLSLLIALGIAVVGLLLRRSSATSFVGGLLLAFGEAALIGGLADWFAVRALFAHPFGIPFPHSALIPRNRARIVAEVSNLVQNEWLPRPILTGKLTGFDFVGEAIIPFVNSHKHAIRGLLRTAARTVVGSVNPGPIAGFLARAAGDALKNDQLTRFVAELLRRAREENWLDPVLYELLRRLEAWAATRESYRLIHAHLEQASEAYRDQGWFKDLTLTIAEAFGGVDLERAAAMLQAEIGRFAREQGADEGQVRRILRDGLANIERRLVEDPAFLEGVRAFLVESTDKGLLPALFEPMLASVQAEGLRALESEDSPLVDWASARLEEWLHWLEHDPAGREQVNGWCRRIGVALIEQHHSLIGKLVEEQLNRLTDEHLVELIEDRVGEDLNWIRLNGTFVGGVIGVALFLLFWVVEEI